jgi:hypothetical protein
MITEGSKANPVQMDPWQLITRVHWSSAPVVKLELEGQISLPNGGPPSFTFLTAPKEGDSVVINGTEIKFGISIGGVAIGADGAACAEALAEYINRDPPLIVGITARHRDATTFIDYDAQKATLNSTSSAIETIGGIWRADPPLEGMITKEMYDGISLLVPGPVNIVGEDLIFLIVTEKEVALGEFALVYRNEYINRNRLSVLFNFKVMQQLEIDIFADAANNYIYLAPLTFPPLEGANPVRLLQTTFQFVTANAYAQGTEFKIEADGKLSTTATPIWTVLKRIPVFDPRGKPGDSPEAVAAYNAFSLPHPYSKVKLDKSGEVVV